MGKKEYTTWLETRERLAAFCRERRSEGLHQLPGERELAARLDCCRVTLRKALESMLEAGTIVRTGRRLEIRDTSPVSATRFRIAFIAYGLHGQLVSGAFQRLYFLLREKMMFRGIDLKLILFDVSTSEAALRARIEEADILLLTGIAIGKRQLSAEECRSLFRGKTVIALSDPWLDVFPLHIGLDNVAVGRLAARVLLQAGCRYPGCIALIRNNVIFHKRFLGFREVMLEAGVPFFCGEKETGGGLHASERKRELNRAAAAGCDGAFLLSDEFVEYIAEDLFRAGAIPERFKLITVNGKGEALCSDPPVTCVSHATEEVAERVMAYLKCLENQTEPPVLRVEVEPLLYLNATVGTFPGASEYGRTEYKNPQL